MHLLGKVSVDYEIPQRISKIKELAYNFWWSWNYEAKDLFKMIEPDIFQKYGRNPVKLLKEVTHTKLIEASKDPEFVQKYDEVIEKFEKYMNEKDTWFVTKYPDHKNNCIAYFSAEFGYHEALPIYSGGLGILAGDHCKSASDLGLPFIGIGLLYKEGYFTQRLNADGWQESKYISHEFTEMPIEPVIDSNGKDVIIKVELPGRDVYAKVWEVKIGRIKVYLLDTDMAHNNPTDRRLTSQLYGGDNEMRISQEILLGIGGVRMCRAIGVSPKVWHMNEGHSVFSVLERVREHIQQKGLNFDESLERIRGNTIFTTHTPVPAGNDAFSESLMEKYFKDFRESLGLSKELFWNLAKHNQNGQELFSLTVLALRTAGISNGVSELHGEVSRDIWEFVWPNIPTDEGPITHITNGIHTLTWLAPEIKAFYDKYLERNWVANMSDEKTWEKVENIPNDELWETHTQLKQNMIEHIRKRVKKMRKRQGASPELIKEIDKMLDPNVLTIGFARRFATYKRANLLFRDLDRLKSIINNSERPVQFIFAGKAHPADQPGKELIKEVFHKAYYDPDLRGKVIIVEDYDMELARFMVRGVDVWMNTPRRPREASGTSGMKSPINGGLNFSVLDGWWCESFNEINGWSIGEEEDYESLDHQDNADSESIYETLEEQIIPDYYDVDNSKKLPLKWIHRMKNSMKTVSPVFNTTRMVEQYVNNLYINGINRAVELGKNNYEMAKQLAKWKTNLRERWNAVKVEPITESIDKEMTSLSVGNSIDVSAKVKLVGIQPEDVMVEIYYGKLTDRDDLDNKKWQTMTMEEKISDTEYVYKGSVTFEEKGDYGYTVRVIPSHKNLPHKHDVGLISWL